MTSTMIRLSDFALRHAEEQGARKGISKRRYIEYLITMDIAKAEQNPQNPAASVKKHDTPPMAMPTLSADRPPTSWEAEYDDPNHIKTEEEMTLAERDRAVQRMGWRDYERFCYLREAFRGDPRYNEHKPAKACMEAIGMTPGAMKVYLLGGDD